MPVLWSRSVHKVRAPYITLGYLTAAICILSPLATGSAYRAETVWSSQFDELANSHDIQLRSFRWGEGQAG